jgi:hypothetical protein
MINNFCVNHDLPLNSEHYCPACLEEHEREIVAEARADERRVMAKHLTEGKGQAGAAGYGAHCLGACDSDRRLRCAFDHAEINCPIRKAGGL